MAVSLGAGGALFASAEGASTASTFTPIDGCRLHDTRDEDRAFADAETRTIEVVGGECEVPADAIAVTLTLTAVGHADRGFLSAWPDGEQSKVSSLNFDGTRSAIANTTTVKLSAKGTFELHASVPTHVIVDIGGYHTLSGAGVTGAVGKTGPAGPAGADGADGKDGADGADGAPGLDGADGAPAVQLVGLTFQSTVTALFGDAPAGVGNGDGVWFGVDLPVDADVAEALDSCRFFGENDDAAAQAWAFEPVPFVLTYSSGHRQFGTIDGVEICDGGTDLDPGFPYPDSINFLDGTNKVYEVRDPDGTWISGPIPDNLNLATFDIARPEVFDLTFYFGNPSYMSYHYDYTVAQDTTVVTRTP